MFSFRQLLSGRKVSSQSCVAPNVLDTGIRLNVDELIRLRLDTRRIRLDSGRLAASSPNAGTHGSRFRGRGIDYQESRGYQPGDDIRNMDWRVTARSGRPHTKLYREERERPVLVVVDLGPSMVFGTRRTFKSVVAAQAATLIAWATIDKGDRIGGLLFNGHHQQLPPRSGRRGVLRLIRALVTTANAPTALSTAGRPGALDEALGRLRRVVRPGSLIFMFSDFYSLTSDAGQHLNRLCPHNDLVACRISDPLELAAPSAGRYRITDGRRSSVLDTHSQAVCRQYETHFATQREAIERLLKRFAVPLLDFTTTDEVPVRLGQALGRLQRRARVLDRGEAA
jgi:uncharacterized protein (DUF58 family)